ncbi:MAG: 23S rRNA (adenine(2030)-N(6))-methyltransferase RlmJ [Thiomicrospira sp.]|jgi:23S rRNA (adenine2030-N6)-methyltransferase|nr:23S rRNA (adenine(2030)-N(6))-methyltransferase RlmJ [Thiomicrospira sp.]
MLSYQHGFHAGNYADVLKHLVLVNILDYMTQKDKPLLYVDTHAGAGGYALASAQAQKTAEYRQGIGRIWQCDEAPQGLASYLAVVEAFNQSAGSAADLGFYPGSPWIAQHLLRPSDRLQLFELHPKEYALLAQAIEKRRGVQLLHQDGFQGLLAALPPKERRGLVLMDPPYEIKTDYAQVVSALCQAYKRFATGTYAIWYPVVERARINQLEKALKNSGIRAIDLYELAIAPDTSARGMTASGMIVINPPWVLKNQMNTLLPWLCQRLAEGQGFYRIETLVEE